MSKRWSMIWNYFTEAGSGRAICSTCSRDVSFVGGSTGNLLRHLRQKHHFNLVSREIQQQEAAARLNPRPFEEGCIEMYPSAVERCVDVTTTTTELLPDRHQYTIVPCVNDTPVNAGEPLSERQSEELDEQLVRMVVKDYHPTSIVESAEFKEFVRILSPSYTLPSREVLCEKLIPHYYHYFVNWAKKSLEEAVAVCISTDSWTSVMNESYVSVTAHFVSADCELRSVLLNCASYTENHTVQDISVMLKRVAHDWEISGKIVAAVSDNDVNVTAAIALCNWKHLQCFAHAINHTVQTGLLDIAYIVAKVKRIVGHFKRNPEFLPMLYSTLKQMGLPTVKLKEDKASRWKSVLDMLQACWDMKDAMISTLSESEFQELLPTQDEWHVVRKAIDVLKIFEELSAEIVSERTLLASKVILFVNALRRRMESFLEDSTLPSEVLSMVKTMDDVLECCFMDIEDNELYTEASLLDPRFKKLGFNNVCSYETAYSSLNQKVQAISSITDKEMDDEASSTSSSEERSSLWEHFDGEVRRLSAHCSPTSIAHTELEKYFEEPLLRRTESALLWWKSRKQWYPHLHEIMKRRLCIVATTLPGEKMFSKAGHVLAEKRSRLSSSKLPLIVFLHENMQ